MAKESLGAVIEFRLPEYLVYGVCIEADALTGDVIAMYSDKFSIPVTDVADLHGSPIRHKIKFFVQVARSRKLSDVLRVIGMMDSARWPKMDSRFRFDMSGISNRPCWQIIDGKDRIVVPHLTEATAHLSEFEIPNLDYIRNYYDSDYYPWSASQVKRGPLDFDPDMLEKKMRATLRPEKSKLS